MTLLRKVDVKYQDSANLDAFARLRMSSPETLFDSIDGVAPTSNSDLYDKLDALIS